MRLFSLLKQAFKTWRDEKARIRRGTRKYRPGTKFVFHNRHMSLDGMEAVVSKNYPEAEKCQIRFANGRHLLAYYEELSEA